MDIMHTRTEVCRLLGLTPNQLQHLYACSRIPEPSRIGHMRVYTVAEIETLKTHPAVVGLAGRKPGRPKNTA